MSDPQDAQFQYAVILRDFEWTQKSCVKIRLRLQKQCVNGRCVCCLLLFVKISNFSRRIGHDPHDPVWRIGSLF